MNIYFGNITNEQIKHHKRVLNGYIERYYKYYSKNSFFARLILFKLGEYLITKAFHKIKYKYYVLLKS